MHEDEITNLNFKELSYIMFFKNMYIFVMITELLFPPSSLLQFPIRKLTPPCNNFPTPFHITHAWLIEPFKKYV